MPTSVRLDPETESLLKQLAHSRSCSKSEVIRDALHRMAIGMRDADSEASIYDLIADLVGIEEHGPQDLARQHKARFRRKLNQGRQ